MARPLKHGLDYFPMDVDFFEDDKIQFVASRFDEKGELIAVKLLCKIFKAGYFIKWDPDVALLFSKGAGRNITPSLANDVVNELIKRDFFHKGLFERFSILTSNGIQKRFEHICLLGRRKDYKIDEMYDVNLFTPEDTQFTTEETELTTEESTQSKVKEKKGKETKVSRANALVAREGRNLKKEYENIIEECKGKGTVEIWSALKSFIQEKNPDFIQPYVDCWNVFVSSAKMKHYKLPHVDVVNETRQKKFKTRMAEPCFDFLKILEKIKASGHLKGNNQRGWTVTFDWILENDSNYVKIIEENYD
jgi:hypothetical protein